MNKHLLLREGISYTAYSDTLGKLTGGVGHLLTAKEAKQYPLGSTIPRAVVEAWYNKDFHKAYYAAQQQVALMGIENTEFTLALMSVNFQLGTLWYKKFPRAWGHLQAGEYESAINEIEGTLWERQTPVRVKDFVEAIRRLT